MEAAQLKFLRQTLESLGNVITDVDTLKYITQYGIFRESLKGQIEFALHLINCELPEEE